MKHNMENHPNLTLFKKWADGGSCPYSDDIQRMFYFAENRTLWKAGKPKLRGIKLMKAICKDKQWIMTGLTWGN